MSEQHLTEDIRAEDTRIGDIETKAASGAPRAAPATTWPIAFDDFMRAFEAFKATNNERIGQIEKRLSADVLTIEKLDRINNAIDEHKAIVDELALKSARPQLGGLDLPLGRDPPAQGSLRGLCPPRRGPRPAQARGEGAVGRLRPDGGYLVPEETEAAVIRGVKNISPIRAIAGNRR